MGDYEDAIRRDIKKRFGSIPKMAEATGLAATTIYHALDRGIKNTRTETSKKILAALYDNPDAARDREASQGLSPDERELLALYRSMSAQGKARLMEQAEFLATRHPLNMADSLGA